MVSITPQKKSGVITPRTRYRVSWTSMARGTWPRDGHRFGSCLTTWRHRRPVTTKTTTVTSDRCSRQSVVTVIRCPSGQLLVLATTEMFTQSTVAEPKTPQSPPLPPGHNVI
ncbi:hypothetical protein FWK35_00005845 [Aphis craccivora]|uniref:Uncharacterized protein n=1 Tax=Aphis craccivora TaxID=307492 RepID=A0A6G0Z7E4_APHCR|nr:hypothetical protein FWK35_00005845 [Aphis craccivora]